MIIIVGMISNDIIKKIRYGLIDVDCKLKDLWWWLKYGDSVCRNFLNVLVLFDFNVLGKIKVIVIF